MVRTAAPSTSGRAGVIGSSTSSRPMRPGPSKDRGRPRAYRGRQDYLDNSIRPLFERLSAPVTPHVRQIWAEEDSVVVRWDSDAAALDGEPYRNSYAWFFTMRDGEVIEATAFLDLPAYDALIDRVKPRPTMGAADPRRPPAVRSRKSRSRRRTRPFRYFRTSGDGHVKGNQGRHSRSQSGQGVGVPGACARLEGCRRAPAKLAGQPRKIHRVIPIAAVSRAAPRRHQPSRPELAQVIRHQVLRLAQQPRQLIHPPVAAGQFPQQPPPHRMPRELQEI